MGPPEIVTCVALTLLFGDLHVLTESERSSEQLRAGRSFVTNGPLLRVLAGVVWVNATNLFDASVGFGGYRESGFGREGGREGLREYLEPAWFRKASR